MRKTAATRTTTASRPSSDNQTSKRSHAARANADRSWGVRDLAEVTTLTQRHAFFPERDRTNVVFERRPWQLGKAYGQAQKIASGSRLRRADHSS
jgi:hypothetical protein